MGVGVGAGVGVGVATGTGFGVGAGVPETDPSVAVKLESPKFALIPVAPCKKKPIPGLPSVKVLSLAWTTGDPFKYAVIVLPTIVAARTSPSTACMVAASSKVKLPSNPFHRTIWR